VTAGSRSRVASRASRLRRAAWVVPILAAGVAWWVLSRPDAPSPQPEELPRIWVDRESLGGACSDARTAREASSPSTPWCSLAKAVKSTPPGKRIRVRAGDYGRLEILGRDRSNTVTFEADPDERVDLSGGLRIEDSSGFRIEGFRISSREYTSSIFRSQRIQVVGNDFSPRGLLLRVVEDFLVAGNTFHDIVREAGKPAPDGYALYVLAVSVGKPGERVRGLAIRDNHFLNVPNDGIQLGGGPEKVIDVTIEGNEFSGIRRRVESDHPDPIQILGGDGVTIRSNYFHDSEVALIVKDDLTRRLILENNVMIGAHGGGIQAQLWDTPGARVVGNTIWRSRLGGLRLADELECCGTPSGIVVRRNIIDKYADGDAAWIAEQDRNVIVSGPRHGALDVASVPEFTSDWQPAGPVASLGAGARLRIDR
jgi:hypothetical protein